MSRFDVRLRLPVRPALDHRLAEAFMCTLGKSLGRIGIAAVVLACAAPAAAQDRPRPVLEIGGGTYLFADDSVIPEAYIGAAGRFYLSPTVSIGPEVTLIWGDRHSHVVATGNVTFDFFAGAGRRRPALTPFITVGAGVFTTRSNFFDRGTDTYTEGAFTAGGGVRGRVSPRVTAGAEARIGWEPHIRINGFVGIDL